MLAGSTTTLSALREVKKFMIGGEAFPATLAAHLSAALPGDIVNLYGPTETTIWSTSHALPREPKGSESGVISIGRPLANQHVYVLNEQRQPQPVGVPGEIWIGGDGVARGYWRRPDLTSRRFCDDPFSPGARMYRTGDYGRYRRDGAIDFLGRADDQVKIRGHRVELGEIEAALMKHPAVRQAVVVLRTEQADDPQLTAYLVPMEKTEAPDPEALRGFLRRTLPEPMLPAVFVTLERFPLTPNGKIDRKAMPAPGQTKPKPNPGLVAPTHGIEADIAAIWAEVLHREQIGVDENFFDLGGHSLQVVQVQMRLRAAHQIDVAALTLFQHPTIRALTRFLAEHGTAESDDAFRRKVDDRANRRRAATVRPPRERLTRTDESSP
jgi:aryl carrier-like protein